MSVASRLPRGPMLLTCLVALVLQVLPLPNFIDVLRPSLLALAVVYWSIAAPRAGGIALGFACGLALDVFRGAVLGQHALALAFIAYIAIEQHQLQRNKPLFEQSLFVMVLVFVVELAAWAIDGWSGHPRSTITRWLTVLTSGLAWWPVVAVLGRTHSRS
jgi:rod shape-determining protein MreD